MEEFKNNIYLNRGLLEEQRQMQGNSLKVLDYWLEYTDKFGSEHVIPAYDRMNWILYYSVDLVIYALIVIFVVIAGTVYVYRSIVRWADQMYYKEIKEHKD